MFANAAIDSRSVRRGSLIAMAAVLMLAGCSGAQVSVPTQFPIPLVRTYPLDIGWHLDEALTNYVHRETIDKSGDWSINLGDAQRPMFDSLSKGMFASHEFLRDPTTDRDLHGVLQPSIKELQFSTPSQTRSDYYEVWIRYQIKLFEPDGTLRGEWPLTAYGKANVQNYGLSTSGPALQEAALAACRDAMAFFTLQFHTIPVVKDWLAEHDVRVTP